MADHMPGITSALTAAIKGVSNLMGESMPEPPDVLGHLQDDCLHRHHFEQLQAYLSDSWDRVLQVYCRMRFDTKFVGIELDTHTTKEIERHWEVGRWMRDTFPAFNNYGFVYHGPLTVALTGTVTIYPAATLVATAAESRLT